MAAFDREKILHVKVLKVKGIHHSNTKLEVKAVAICLMNEDYEFNLNSKFSFSGVFSCKLKFIPLHWPVLLPSKLKGCPAMYQVPRKSYTYTYYKISHYSIRMTTTFKRKSEFLPRNIITDSRLC